MRTTSYSTPHLTMLSDPVEKAVKDYGAVQKVYGRVSPVGHGEAVIEDLKQLQKA